MRIPRPAYDRSAITVGIVHFGVGGFHRAHEAVHGDLADDERFAAAHLAARADLRRDGPRAAPAPASP